MSEFNSPQELVQLAQTNNTNALEAAWLEVAENDQMSVAALCDYAPVLSALCEVGKTDLAETFTTTVLDSLKSRASDEEVLKVAGAFLLAVGNSDSLRNAVCDLYRAKYGDRDGFAELLTEAGLPGGRPVRRALRTLDVCLDIDAGSYLVGRHEEEAARVESVDTGSWEFSLTTADGGEELGAVKLADRFRAGVESDFVVQKQFFASELAERLSKSPDDIVISLCRENGNTIDTIKLEELLGSSALPGGDFKKWWTKARAALKKRREVRVEGRSPYTIAYDDSPVSVEDETRNDFDRHRDPIARYEIIRKYVQECPGRAVEPNADLLNHCHATLARQAAKCVDRKEPRALVVAAMAGHIGELAGIESHAEDVQSAVAATTDLGESVAKTDDSALLDRIVDALVAVRPEGWAQELLALLPSLPHGFCDRAVERMLGAGVTVQQVSDTAQTVLKSPADCFEALLWLWDGPKETAILEGVSLPTVLTRILRALNKARVSDAIDKAQGQVMAQRARNVLSARKFARYDECLKSVDAGLAQALKTQINQSENLGPAARETMLRRLQPLLPKLETGPAIPPWAMEDVLYSTEAGMARKDAEIEHHVNVKIKENAKAIGAAAEKGDLGENSEYKFALEERDLLQARLAQMNSERSSARVLSGNLVPTDHIGIGTRAVFKNIETGAPYEMTFVGPWDADIDQGLFNYKAPLAQLLMGKKIGDIVEFEHGGQSGSFEVAELHNALKDGTLATPQPAR